MANENTPNPEFDPREDLNAAPVDPGGAVPVEGEDQEGREQPRRAASAEFIVQSDAGSEAILRDAMDPANQSLQEALRLSYRVLQVVMLVLVVLFVFSGFQTVETRESGVMLRWGKILEVDGKKALEPGLQFSKWPYPVGEFVLFDARDRQVSLQRAFWPAYREDSLQDAISRARVNSPLRPGQGGYLLIGDGDIGHLSMGARYDITDPVMFVNHVVNRSEDPTAVDADTLVRLSLQRAAVHTAAGLPLDEFRTMGDTTKAEIQQSAQEQLDRVDSGITIRTLTDAQALPALAVEQIYTSTEEARERARNQIKEARQQKEQTLIATAGQSYQVLEDYINRYDEALALGDEARAEAVADEINAFLDLVGDENAIGERPEGRVAQIISEAKAYTSQIESTLGNEARRFAAIKPIYDENPEIVIARLWSDAYSYVLSRQDVEIFFAPESIGGMQLGLRGSDRIRQIRRDLRLEREQRETYQRETANSPYLRSLSDVNREGPGRRLDRTGGSRSR